MRLTPVLTEKSLKLAKEGYYTFWVGKDMDKGAVKRTVETIFGVHVTSVKTLNFRGGRKKNLRGQFQKVKSRKKALVSLKGEEKIDLFEEKKK